MSDICRISISDDSFVHFSVKIISAPKKIKNNFDKKTKSFEILNSKTEKNQDQDRWEIKKLLTRMETIQIKL